MRVGAGGWERARPERGRWDERGRREMSTNPLLHAVTGAAPVRLLVNEGFHRFAKRRMDSLGRKDPVRTQRRTLRRLLRRAERTRFGRDHGFRRIRSVAEYQRAVPLRDYEALWRDYLGSRYPVLRNATWPGRIPYFALTSGTTLGATKAIPVSRAMIHSNRRAAKTVIAQYLASRPDSKLFLGKSFMLGGSTALESPARGVRAGDLSAISAIEVGDWLQPYAFPPLDVALETNWERKLARLTELSARESIRLVSGVPSWLLTLFRSLLAHTGRRTIAEVWPDLEMVVHGGVRFEPYRAEFARLLGDEGIRLQETYPASEGFLGYGDMHSDSLRLMFDHGIFYEFVPLEELGSANPTRHWLGTARPGINYAVVLSTCAGLWGHVLGDTIRFERTDPPLFKFTGRTKYCLSAFGEHLILEEVEGAVEAAASATGARVSDWHAGPVFEAPLGRHLYFVEFCEGGAPRDLEAFAKALDADLLARNADYAAHRAEGVGLPRPEVRAVAPGGFAAWMKSKGKLGGQHKVPRMDGTGKLTGEMAEFFGRRGG